MALLSTMGGAKGATRNGGGGGTGDHPDHLHKVSDSFFFISNLIFLFFFMLNIEKYKFQTLSE